MRLRAAQRFNLKSSCFSFPHLQCNCVYTAYLSPRESDDWQGSQYREDEVFSNIEGWWERMVFPVTKLLEEDVAYTDHIQDDDWGSSARPVVIYKRCCIRDASVNVLKILPLSEDTLDLAHIAEVNRRSSKTRRSNHCQVGHSGDFVIFPLQVLASLGSAQIRWDRLNRLRLHWMLLKTMQL